MPTYIQKITDSDLSPFVEFNKVISSGTGTDTSVSVALTGSEVVTGGFITESGVPNSDQWEDSGTWTVEIEVDAGNHQIAGAARCVRLDSDGTVLQSGSYTATQILNSNRSFSPVAPAWTEGEEDADNRLAVEIQLTNNHAGDQSVTIGVGTTENEVVTDITENNISGPTLVSGDVDLFVRGFDQSSGNIDLFVNGNDQSSGNIDLFINGWDNISGSIDLFTSAANNTSGNIDLFIEGKTVTSGNIDFFINGRDSISGNLDLFINGNDVSSGTINLFIGSKDSSSGTFDLFINGLDQFSGSIDLFINGNDQSSGNINLFVYGYDNVSGFIDLFIHGYKSLSNVNKIYFNNTVGTPYIWKANADGSSIEQLPISEPIDTSLDLIVNHGERKLYLAVSVQDDRIVKCDLDGNNSTTIVSGIDVSALDIDTIDQYIFFGDFDNDAIKRCGLDGSDIQTIVPTSSGIGDIKNISIDILGRKLYWLDSLLKVVKKSNIDGSNVGTIISGLNIPRGLLFNPINQKIYISDIGDNVLYVANSDGSNSGILIDWNILEGNGQGYKAQIDISQQKLYIPNDENDEIETFDLDGSNRIKFDAANGTTALTIEYKNIVNLFIGGHNQSSGNIDLFISGIVTATPTSGSTDLYVNGFNNSSGSIDLFEHGHNISSGNIDLFINGNDQSSGNINLFIHGRDNVSGSIDLFIGAVISISGDCDLFINGHNFVSGDVDLFIDGLGLTSGDITLFISSINLVSNDIDLYLVGKPSGDISVFIGGNDASSGNINLLVNGIDLISGILDLFVNGQSISSGIANLFIGGNGISSSNIGLFIPGAELINNNIPLFVSSLDSQNNSIDLFVNGFDISSGNIDLIIDGFISVNNQIDLFVSGDIGVFQINNNFPLFTEGSGILIINNIVNLFINGIFSTDGQIDFIINGFEQKPDDTCPILDPNASVQISNDLIEIYQSRIDALINQLGKNVLLEFDPIRNICPNCIFDSIRKKSTGIYKQGGPRSFKRGRQCPWCKGRGFEETPVQKCIKCLTKWNPQNLEDYGISANDYNDIVIFKTYLTEFDDIIRAKTAIANYSIQDKLLLRVRLIKHPTVIGLRESRYCVSAWELIDS